MSSPPSAEEPGSAESRRLNPAGFSLLLPGDKPTERKVGHRTNKACRCASEQRPRKVLPYTEVLELPAHLKIHFDNGTALDLCSALWIRISWPPERKFWGGAWRFGSFGFVSLGKIEQAPPSLSVKVVVHENFQKRYDK
jgi:hypothetical protein